MKLTPIETKGCANLYRHPKTGIIYFQAYRKGKGQIEKSTRTRDLNEAKGIADGYRLEFLGVSKIKRGKSMCGELFPPWIERKSVSLRKSSIENANSSWSNLKPYVENMLPEEITAAWWEKVYIPGKREMAPNRKFFNDRKWLGMFLLALTEDGTLAKTPKLLIVDPPVAAGKVYSDEEIKGLLEHATGELYLQTLMAFTMGMRKGEIMGMKLGRIDFDKRTMHLRSQDTKTKKARTFGISAAVWECIEALQHEYGPDAPLFQSPRGQNKAQGSRGNHRSWGKCRLNAGIFGRFHDLRHTFLTKAFKQSTNPALICNYAGLSLEEAERTYLHFTPDDTRVVSTLVRFELS